MDFGSWLNDHDGSSRSLGPEIDSVGEMFAKNGGKIDHSQMLSAIARSVKFEHVNIM